MANWQPIESAPKVEALYLGFARGPHGEHFWGVIEWADADEDFPGSVAGWFWPFATQPTHWMHLPAPPTSS